MEGGGEDWTDSAGQKSWRRAFVAKRFGANETGTEGPFYRVLGDAKLRRSNIAGPSSNGRTPDFGSGYGGSNPPGPTANQPCEPTEEPTHETNYRGRDIRDDLRRRRAGPRAADAQ